MNVYQHAGLITALSFVGMLLAGVAGSLLWGN